MQGLSLLIARVYDGPSRLFTTGPATESGSAWRPAKGRTTQFTPSSLPARRLGSIDRVDGFDLIGVALIYFLG